MTNQTSQLRETTPRSSDLLPSARGETALAQLRRRIAATASSDSAGADSSLADPFAEIFAAIAAVEPPPPPVASTPESPTDEPDRAEPIDEPKANADVAPAQPHDAAQAHLEPPPIAATPVDQITPPSHLTGDAEQVTSNPASTPVAAGDLSANTGDRSDEGEQDLSVDLEGDVQAQQDLQNEAIAVEVVKENGPAEDLPRELQTVDTANQGGDGYPAESKQPEVVEVPAHVNREPEAGDIVRRSEVGELSDGADGKGEQPANRHETGETTPRVVERRRYSDSPQQEQSPDAATQADPPGETDSRDSAMSRGELATPAARTPNSLGNGGVDISGMTPVSAMSTPAAAIVAAATQTSVTAGSGRTGAQPAAISTASGGGATVSESPSAFSLTDAGKLGRESKDAGGTKTSGGVDTTAAVERARLAQRVSRGFQHLGGNGGQIRMKLSPDHLGTVQLQMTIRDGKLNGKMVTQSDAATEMLREQLPGLRASLESQGIRLEHIDIETETSSERFRNGSDSGQSQDFSEGFAEQQSARQQQTTGGRSRSTRAGLHAARPSVSPVHTVAASTTSLPILSASVDLQV